MPLGFSLPAVQCTIGERRRDETLATSRLFDRRDPCQPQRPQTFPDCQSGTPIPFNDGDSWGYVTVSGIAIPPSFKSALPFSGGLALACTELGCAVIYTKGQFVSPVREPHTFLLASRYTDGIGA